MITKSTRPLIRLYFDSTPTLRLERTDVKLSSESKTTTCFRGSAFNLPQIYSGFRWTTAVQALSILFLRHVAKTNPHGVESSAEQSEDEFLLEGEDGSLASSLDYAIAKQPNWIQDMFGLSHGGVLVLRDFVIRANPERKRPGPVRISINSRKLKPSEVEVYCDNRAQVDPDQLLAMAEAIASQTEQPTKLKRKTKTKLSSHLEWKIDSKGSKLFRQLEVGEKFEDNHQYSSSHNPLLSDLKSAYFDEIHEALRSSVVFDYSRYNARTAFLQNLPEVRRRNYRGLSLDNCIDRSLFNAEGLGLVDNDDKIKSGLKTDQPLKVVIPQAEGSTQALFTYLKLVKGYSIEITQHFPHALKISEEMRSEAFQDQYDLSLLSLASAASYSSSKRRLPFAPFMIMPTISYRAVSPNNAGQSPRAFSSSQIYYIGGSASFTACISEMLDRKFKKLRGESLEFQNQTEIAEAIANSEPHAKALLWFPHDYILRASKQAQFYSEDLFPEEHVGGALRSELILFCNQRLSRDPVKSRALAIALRGAWLHLTQDHQLLAAIIDYMLGDRHHPIRKYDQVVAAETLNAKKELHLDQLKVA